MSDETYNGWSNRETWAVAYHINNDRGWRESVYEALRGAREGYRKDNDEAEDGAYESRPYLAGEVIRENVEDVLEPIGDEQYAHEVIIPALRDIGSLWRVDWTELGASFLDAIKDES